MSKFYQVTVNGTVYEVEVEEVVAGTSAPAESPKATVAPKAAAPKAPVAPKAAVGKGTPVSAPMQGTILKVAVTAGQAVRKGDLICLLEAMKMENEIFAPCDGTVTSVAVTNGQAVATGATLVTIS